MMDRIAPLAKILAEANGIDWQRLNGTGEGGMIVEQDILNYLSRVMSGEEEPPETPVDLPPPDWEGDLANSNFDMAALSAAGVDADITSYIEQARPSAPHIPATPVSTFQEDAMEFEMDEGEDDGEDLLTTEPPAFVPAAQIEVPDVAAAVPEPEVQHAAAVIPERIVVPEPALPEPVRSEPVQPEPIQIPAAAVVPPAAAAANKGGLGGLLSRLYQNRAAPQDTPAAPAPSMVGPAFATPKDDVSMPAVSMPEVAAPNITVPDIAAPMIPDIALPSLAAPEVAAPELTAADLSIEAEQNTPDFSAPQVELPSVSGSVSDAVQPWASKDDVVPMAAAATPEVQPVPTPDPVAAAMIGAVATSGAGLSQSVTAPAALPQGAVWFGTYLRRDAQVAAATDLREQLSEALSRDVPLALLVARAAQQHAAILDLSAVAIQDPSVGRTRSAKPGSIRDAVTALDTDHDGTPDLLIVDAGLLDLDDLHYPHALTLSVGRVQGGRAALTLNGNVDTERAARFLASVAQTLEKPVILLV
ncbi:E3 binding domain-containing protein [Deinococcus sp. QL22]|uniref:E3 binding domain-containing protein n=1 Tax=Deinococcus sp. QL22 TaxID=2939437 RepID=UPI002016BDB7|nr:E3 binding domain-containing protein [Deinococcus sp. QL22]UQN05117.1 E3 binding domain-containing protein [Deinococcus sp. QL22]